MPRPHPLRLTPVVVLICLHAVFLSCSAFGQVPGALEEQLLRESPRALAEEARASGDARRGAILFYQPYLTCTKCHTAGAEGKPLGPELTRLEKGTTAAHLVESVLKPSEVIKKGYETVTVVTRAGKSYTGLLVEETRDGVVLRDAAENGREVTIPAENIEEKVAGKVSVMPKGLVNQLAGRQQFLDLVRYLIEIGEQGPARALELKPAESLIVARPLPAYEQDIDHAGMIAAMDGEAFQRGEAIYNRLCINCHGTHDRPGSLPTSLRFATDKFKNGSDPYTMYRTLTYGFGLMVPQTWMVPRQKYDVIHYIREAYLREHNTSQYTEVTQEYLAALPRGETFGPEPVAFEPWVTMDYGPSLINTYEIGDDGSNFAYKGIAVRLDPGPGGVSRGRYWMVFDHDTLRGAAGWSGEGFIDWNGIHFNGRHQVHPRTVGRTRFANPTGPGWTNPANGTFNDPRLRGRDGRPYGPLPREWAHYKGLYHHGQKTIISYSVGETDVLEMPGVELPPVSHAAGGSQTQESPADDSTMPAVFTRTFNIGGVRARSREMILQVARHPAAEAKLTVLPAESLSGSSVVTFGPDRSTKKAVKRQPLEFNGSNRLDVAGSSDFDLTDSDYTITARIRTRAGGSIFSKTAAGEDWVPDGKVFFVRGGRLCFDIGWVGVVQSRRRVDDGRWHNVAVTWNHETGRTRLYVDGLADGDGTLKPRDRAESHVVRIGFAAPNFPQPASYFSGDIEHLRFYQRRLVPAELSGRPPSKDLIADWHLADAAGQTVIDLSENGHDASVRHAPGSDIANDHLLLVGVSPALEGMKWKATEEGDLRLQIPAGTKPLKCTLWIAQPDERAGVAAVLAGLNLERPDLDLSQFTQGGPARWPEKLKTQPVLGDEERPFAVDVLTHPADNPWLCRMRFTALDFFPEGDRAVLSAWDGDVWQVSGLLQPEQGLTWQRIASGLFQPLGVKIVEGEIYITCRDQIVILRDLNGDGETDFYENFNNDHQVTEHFHEFAMGLQTDTEGNLYYAKSARHALPAVVPHHGTLLRVSKDGSRTEILATGFRAANGVCLNSDGTFIVTDQEGHWNPKNRINWVEEGSFYGNMFGYHDVTDTSDEAMEQPLCWITNEFDRSPGELLWVDSDAWGPLEGSLLNFSYGYGKVYVVPHETVDGQVQGGMCAFPIDSFPTGTMRGRFHPVDGQLYTCGMFAWAGSRQQPGGWYRIRYTGRPVHLPVGLNAQQNGMAITFSGAIDPQSVADLDNYAVKVWSLKRTAEYGSKHYNEHPLKVTAVRLSDDGRRLFLEIPEITPTWCMEIKYTLRSAEGKRVEGVIHNTVHNLPDGATAEP